MLLSFERAELLAVQPRVRSPQNEKPASACWREYSAAYANVSMHVDIPGRLRLRLRRIVKCTDKTRKCRCAVGIWLERQPDNVRSCRVERRPHATATCWLWQSKSAIKADDQLKLGMARLFETPRTGTAGRGS